MHRRKRLALKKIVEAATSQALKFGGVNGLIAGVVSRLFWRFIVVPIVKHAHKKGGLRTSKTSIVVQKHGKVWHNLNYEYDFTM